MRHLPNELAHPAVRYSAPAKLSRYHRGESLRRFELGKILANEAILSIMLRRAERESRPKLPQNRSPVTATRLVCARHFVSLSSIKQMCYRYAMPEFVIERDIPGAGSWTEDQIRNESIKSLDVLHGMSVQIQWLHSYVTDDKIYCVYMAPDEALIREHAKRLGAPANRISAVRRMIDPAKYSSS